MFSFTAERRKKSHITHLITEPLQRLILLGLASKAACRMQAHHPLTTSRHYVHRLKVYPRRGWNGITPWYVMCTTHTQDLEERLVFSDIKCSLWLHCNNGCRVWVPPWQCDPWRHGNADLRNWTCNVISILGLVCLTGLAHTA